MAQITVIPERLINDLNTLRSFGSHGLGVIRPAFSDMDLQSRQWLVQQMEKAGLKGVIDPVGNVFGLPPGDGKVLLLGSHTDTQPEGGWLDGAFGVMAALEIARASLENGGPPVAVVSFQDEEGRFGPLLGSNIWTGGLSLVEADRMRDNSGLTFGEARQKIADICQNSFVSPDRFSGYIEAHIEQGVVLDKADLAIGVVDSIVGIRTETFSFSGEQNHAGTTPMHLRRDAFQGAVSFINNVNQAFEEVVTSDTVWTVGRVEVHPNATSIVPGRVVINIQWRDGDDARLDAMREVIWGAAEKASNNHGLTIKSSCFSGYPATNIDDVLQSRIKHAAELLSPGKWMTLPSGALHDASNVSRHLPVAMLFVPSINGISHNFAEDTELKHLVLGAQVLGASAFP